MSTKIFVIGLVILFNFQQLLTESLDFTHVLPATGKYYKKAVSRGSFSEGNCVISPVTIVLLDYVHYLSANKNVQNEYNEIYFAMNKDEIIASLRNFIMPTVDEFKQWCDVEVKVVIDVEFGQSAETGIFCNSLMKDLLCKVNFEDVFRRAVSVQRNMNSWAVQFTEGNVDAILPVLSADSNFVAASLILSHIRWLNPFTADRASNIFYSIKMGKIEKQKVIFMTLCQMADDSYDAFEYEEPWGSIIAVRIPLETLGMAMFIYMPSDPQNFSTFLTEWSDNNDILRKILSKSQRENDESVHWLRVKMPRFSIPALQSPLNLMQLHKSFGLHNLVDPVEPSMFSNENGKNGVNPYYHNTMIIVDENGIGMRGQPPVEQPRPILRVAKNLHVTIKNPFLFQIVGTSSFGFDMIYYTGHIADAYFAQL